MATYKGFSTVDRDFKSTRLVDRELIRRDLLNHFSIRKGEKLHNPEFGSAMYSYVMEPLTEDLKDLIMEDVNAVFDNDPRVQVESMIIDDFENGLYVNVDVRYVQTNEVDTLRVTFNREDGTISL